MRIPRIYHPHSLQDQTHCELSDEAVNHVARVLRMQTGQELALFDGSNRVYHAEITSISKKHVSVNILSQSIQDNESHLDIHLGQVISRGDKMEFTIQKSVELGVNCITPLWSERCGVKLDTERMHKKVQQWQKIVIAACEQCGRNKVPEVREIMKLEDWCKEPTNKLKINLHPRATMVISQLTQVSSQGVRLLIGSEGGLSPQEIDMTQQYDFKEVLLGKRVLRTETAALTAVTALQVCFGDLG